MWGLIRIYPEIVGLLRRRKSEPKSAAYPFPALDPHLPAVGLNYLLNYGQAQASAAGTPGTVYLVEPLKQMRQVIWRDAHTRVFNGNFHKSPQLPFVRGGEGGFPLSVKSNLAVGGGKFNCVFHQVNEDLPYPVFIGHHFGEIKRKI
jgi:hypothetical protein